MALSARSAKVGGACMLMLGHGSTQKKNGIGSFESTNKSEWITRLESGSPGEGSRLVHQQLRHGQFLTIWKVVPLIHNAAATDIKINNITEHARYHTRQDIVSDPLINKLHEYQQFDDCAASDINSVVPKF